MQRKNTCRECGAGGPFYPRRYGICIPCENRQSREWHQQNPERSREINLKHRAKKYGLTPEDWRATLEAQGNVCALCGRPPTSRALCMDHDHETGRVRGFLCNRCNGALGQLGDNVEGLRRALDYLENPPAFALVRDAGLLSGAISRSVDGLGECSFR